VATTTVVSVIVHTIPMCFRNEETDIEMTKTGESQTSNATIALLLIPLCNLLFVACIHMSNWLYLSYVDNTSVFGLI